MNILAQIIFPIFGLLMIIFALGSFYFPYGEKIKEATQKFDAFGIKMEISVVTAIIIGGMIFCGISFYIQEHGYKNDKEKLEAENKQHIDNITRLQNQVDDKNDRINALTTQNITYHFVLADLSDTIPPPSASSLKCIFYKNWRDKSDSAEYRVFSSGANAFKVTFENLSLAQLADASPAVYLYDKKSKKRWVDQSFNPLTPTILLKPDE
jgi:hypothetical protein